MPIKNQKRPKRLRKEREVLSQKDNFELQPKTTLSYVKNKLIFSDYL